MPSKDGRGRDRISKVGPALTFALREGLFALEQIERELYGMMDFPCSHFRGDSVEQVMLEDQGQWTKYYHALCRRGGTPGLQLLRPGPVLPDQQQGTGCAPPPAG